MYRHFRSVQVKENEKSKRGKRRAASCLIFSLIFSFPFSPFHLFLLTSDFHNLLIIWTEIETAEKLDLKPSKVVAGLEADKTNHFLQVLAKVAMDKKTASAAADVQHEEHQQQPSQLVTGKKTLEDTKPSPSTSGRPEKAAKKSTNKLKTSAKQKDETSALKTRTRKETSAQIDPQGDTRENESSDVRSDRKTSADQREASGAAPSPGSGNTNKGMAIHLSGCPLIN